MPPPGDHVQARIVGRAEESVLVEDQRLGESAGRDVVSGRRNGDGVKAHAGSGRIGQQRGQRRIADPDAAANTVFGLNW